MASYKQLVLLIQSYCTSNNLYKIIKCTRHVHYIHYPIYILACDTCGIQYVGETMDKFNIRLNNHLLWYKTNKNYPLTRHFCSKKHHFDNVTFQIIKVNTEWDTTARRRRENFWIHQLHTLEPNGHNEKDKKRYRKDKEQFNTQHRPFYPVILANGRCKLQPPIL